MTDWFSELSQGKSKPINRVPQVNTGSPDWYQELSDVGAPPASKRKPTSLEELNKVVPIANLESNEGTAGFKTLSKAAFVDDPQTKLSIVAKDLFPKLSTDKALERVGMLPDGEIIYQGEDDKLYRATPQGFSGWAEKKGAELVGHAPAIVGSVIGGVIAAPSGPGIVAGSGLGAAAGEGYRKAIGGMVFNEPQTISGNFKSMGVEGLWGAGSALVGLGVAKLLQRGQARDIARLDTAKSADLQQKAQAAGIDLNPADITNLPSLKSKVDVLASMPTSKDIIEESLVRKGQQAGQAMASQLDELSQIKSGAIAGDLGKQAAQSVVSQVTSERAKLAKPLYEAAFQNRVTITPELKELAQRPAMETARTQAIKLAANEGEQIGNPLRSVKGLHYMKKALDDMIEKRGESGLGPIEKRSLVGIKKNLLDIMDNMSDDYANARKIYSDYSPGVDKVREGLVGLASETKDLNTSKIPKLLFGPTTAPEDISSARIQFFRSGKGDEWNGLLRAHLQNLWEKAGQEYASGSGAVKTQAPKFRALAVGNKAQAENLKAAMTARQWNTFNDLMEVFDASGRTAWAGAGSQTMGRQEAANIIRSDSGAGIIGTAAAPQQIPGRLRDWIAEARLGKHAERIAQVITSPESMSKLRDIKKLSPNDMKFITGLSDVLGVGAVSTTRQEKPDEAILPSDIQANF